MAIEIVTGDPVRRIVQLVKLTDAQPEDGETFVINGAATVTAAIVGPDRETKLSGDSDQTSGETGADWSTSKVALVIPETETADITAVGEAYIELQVDDSYKQTWFIPAVIIKGNIT
jgi:hypothetical protein